MSAANSTAPVAGLKTLVTLRFTAVMSSMGVVEKKVISPLRVAKCVCAASIIGNRPRAASRGFLVFMILGVGRWLEPVRE